jgi:hypothetical protein
MRDVIRSIRSQFVMGDVIRSTCLRSQFVMRDVIRSIRSQFVMGDVIRSTCLRSQFVMRDEIRGHQRPSEAHTPASALPSDDERERTKASPSRRRCPR